MRCWLLILIVLTLATPANAHIPGGAPEGYERMLADCSDDYGFHNNDLSQRGHDLVTLEITETAVGGVDMVVFQLVVSQNDDSVGKRDTLSFEAPQFEITTTIETLDEEAFTHAAGTAPAYIDGPFEVELAESLGGGPDGTRKAYEVGYTYDQLRLQVGEALSSFAVSGQEQDSLGNWVAGDDMPSSCPGDEVLYVAGQYTSAASPWTPSSGTPPTASIAGDDRLDGAGSIAFAGSGDDPDGHPIVSWLWDVTGPAPATVDANGDAATVWFDRVGLYSVALTVIDGAGESTTVTHDVLVDDRLALDATFLDSDARRAGVDQYDGPAARPAILINAVHDGADDAPAAVEGFVRVLYKPPVGQQREMGRVSVSGVGEFTVELPSDAMGANLPGRHIVHVYLTSESHPDAEAGLEQGAILRAFDVRLVGVAGAI